MRLDPEGEALLVALDRELMSSGLLLCWAADRNWQRRPI